MSNDELLFKELSSLLMYGTPTEKNYAAKKLDELFTKDQAISFRKAAGLKRYTVTFYTMSDCTATVEVYASNRQDAIDAVMSREDCDTIVSVAEVV